MKTKKSRSSKTSMLILVSLGVVVFALFLVVVSFAKGADKPSLREQTLTKKRYDIPVDGFPSVGPVDAPVVIVEFSSFDCEYCALFARTTFPLLMGKYPKVARFVFRQAPSGSELSPGFKAAEAALCANDQNYFLEYHDALFENRDRLGKDLYRELATNLRLDMPTFDACLENKDYKDWVQNDLDFAFKLGVRGTPTFFINGLALVGAQPAEVFVEVIDAELEKLNTPK